MARITHITVSIVLGWALFTVLVFMACCLVMYFAFGVADGHGT